MPFAKNLSRIEAFNEKPEPNSVFINVCEPKELGYDSFHSEPLNCPLSQLDTLVVSFSDVANLQFAQIWNLETKKFDEVVVPLPSDYDLKRIYNFIVKNQGKNFYASCMAGVGRSGSMIQFLVEYFGYRYVEPNKKRISSNSYMLKKFVELYQENKGNLTPYC